MSSVGECCECGDTEGVTLQDDPFLLEVYGEQQLRWYCEGCWLARKEEI